MVTESRLPSAPLRDVLFRTCPGIGAPCVGRLPAFLFKPALDRIPRLLIFHDGTLCPCSFAAKFPPMRTPSSGCMKRAFGPGRSHAPLSACRRRRRAPGLCASRPMSAPTSWARSGSRRSAWARQQGWCSGRCGRAGLHERGIGHSLIAASLAAAERGRSTRVILVGRRALLCARGFLQGRRAGSPARTRRPRPAALARTRAGAFEGVAGAVMPAHGGKSCTCDNGGGPEAPAGSMHAIVAGVERRHAKPIASGGSGRRHLLCVGQDTRCRNAPQ